MPVKGKINFFKEKKILQEEEKSLKKMRDKFEDQLNRLKIEELALVHLIRMQQTEANASKAAATTSQAPKTQPAGAANKTITLSDSDNELQSASMWDGHALEKAADGTAGMRDWWEDVAGINQEKLDLEVPQGFSHGHSHLMSTEGKDQEEEEEEEEDEDEDPAGDEMVREQLRSFMEDF